MPGLEILDERDDGDVAFELNGAYFTSGRRSPGGRYLVCTAGGHEQGGRTRAGRVVLLDLVAKRIRFKKPLKRANNPWVSDEGLVAVENWVSWDGPPAGEVVVYRPSGDRAWKKRFKANLYGTHLAANGKHLLVSTCNSDHAAHSGKTWLLDLHTGEQLWQRDGFGQVRFDGSQAVIGIAGDRIVDDNRFFPLGADGSTPIEFEQARSDAEDRANRGKPWWVFSKVEEALRGPAPEVDLIGLLPILDEMEAQNEIDDRTRARAYRMRGEIAERVDRLEDAYAWWTRALQLDPKVGVKRRHIALGRKLGATTDEPTQ